MPTIRIPALSANEREKESLIRSALYDDNTDLTYAIIITMQRIEAECIDRIERAHTSVEVCEIMNDYSSRVQGVRDLVKVICPSLSGIFYQIGNNCKIYDVEDRAIAKLNKVEC